MDLAQMQGVNIYAPFRMKCDNDEPGHKIITIEQTDGRPLEETSKHVSYHLRAYDVMPDRPYDPRENAFRQAGIPYVPEQDARLEHKMLGQELHSVLDKKMNRELSGLDKKPEPPRKKRMIVLS